MNTSGRATGARTVLGFEPVREPHSVDIFVRGLLFRLAIERIRM